MSFSKNEKELEKIKAFVIEPDPVKKNWSIVNMTKLLKNGHWECGINMITSIEDVVEQAYKENVPIVTRKFLETDKAKERLDVDQAKEKIGADKLYLDGTYRAKNGKWGIVEFKIGKIIKEPFADGIYSDGTYKIGNQEGIINLKTGEIIREPFADIIYSDGSYKIGGKYGKVDLKTGKEIKKI